MMTRADALRLRTLIHEAEISARTERSELISLKCYTRESLRRIAEIERERDLAMIASAKLWEVREAPEGTTDPVIKLWNAIRRAAGISFDRWAPILVSCEKLFRGNLLTPSAR